MAKLFLATLCNDVREEKTGKFSLLGVFDRFLVADFRAPLSTFWLFAQVDAILKASTCLRLSFVELKARR
jgi:hypothetical protein